MIVKLEIFKRSGKWYTDGKYKTKESDLHSIWSEVAQMRAAGFLPGLIPGGTHTDFMVYVDVPKHPFRHPHLVV